MLCHDKRLIRTPVSTAVPSQICRTRRCNYLFPTLVVFDRVGLMLWETIITPNIATPPIGSQLFDIASSQHARPVSRTL